MHDKVTMRRWLERTAEGAAVVALIGCAQTPPQAIAAGPPPAGEARIWFYRDYQPSVTRNMANVAINGTPAGSVPFYKGFFYRDVAPGHYRISVESFGDDGHQSGDIDLAPGQQLYVKILVNQSWIDDGGGDRGGGGYHRDTFDVSFVPPGVAYTEIASIHP